MSRVRRRGRSFRVAWTFVVVAVAVVQIVAQAHGAGHACAHGVAQAPIAHDACACCAAHPSPCGDEREPVDEAPADSHEAGECTLCRVLGRVPASIPVAPALPAVALAVREVVLAPTQVPRAPHASPESARGPPVAAAI